MSKKEAELTKELEEMLARENEELDKSVKPVNKSPDRAGKQRSGRKKNI